jgi:hypothetical protein
MKLIEVIKDIASTASCTFYRVSEERCQKCPAYWASVDYWGEGDSGCTLHRDNLEFCPLSLLPKAIMKPYVKHKEKQEEKYWDRVYEEECRNWAKEEGDTP